MTSKVSGKPAAVKQINISYGLLNPSNAVLHIWKWIWSWVKLKCVLCWEMQQNQEQWKELNKKIKKICGVWWYCTKTTRVKLCLQWYHDINGRNAGLAVSRGRWECQRSPLDFKCSVSLPYWTLREHLRHISCVVCALSSSLCFEWRAGFGFIREEHLNWVCPMYFQQENFAHMYTALFSKGF